MHNFEINTRRPSSQRGIVLIVGLVFVLLITIVGLSAIRGTGLQESMAGNLRDRNIAFQATESTLREAEATVGPLSEDPCPDGCPNYDKDPEKNIVLWSKENWKNLATNSALTLENISGKPQYVVEELEADIGANAAAEGSAIDIGGMMTTGDATPYRISAKSYGMSEQTEVILQSTYKRRF